MTRSPNSPARRGLTNYHIKLLAALLMVVDHVGAVLLPEVTALRVVGRLSFPLFAWLLAQGEAHTRDVQRYGLRLLVWGIVSQPIFWLTFQNTNGNILFTLLIGLVCLRLARLAPDYQPVTWIVGGTLAELARVDYGAYGIGAIALLAHFQPRPLWWLVWGALHALAIVGLPGYGTFQLPAIAAPLIVQAANHQPGAKARWFYLFYPGHLLVLYLIRLWLQSP